MRTDISGPSPDETLSLVLMEINVFAIDLDRVLGEVKLDEVISRYGWVRCPRRRNDSLSTPLVSGRFGKTPN